MPFAQRGDTPHSAATTRPRAHRAQGQFAAALSPPQAHSLRHPEACQQGRPQGDITPRGIAARYIAWTSSTYRRPRYSHGLYRIAARQYIARCKAASPSRHSEAANKGGRENLGRGKKPRTRYVRTQPFRGAKSPFLAASCGYTPRTRRIVRQKSKQEVEL